MRPRTERFVRPRKPPPEMAVVPAQRELSRCKTVLSKAAIQTCKTKKTAMMEDARSKFPVCKFHGPQGTPLYPDEGESSDESSVDSWGDSSGDSWVASPGASSGASSGDSASENNSHDSTFPSFLLHENEHKKALTRDTRKRKATPSQFASPFDYHGVPKKVFTSDTEEGNRAGHTIADVYHRVHKKRFDEADSGQTTAFDYNRVHKKRFDGVDSGQTIAFDYYRVHKKRYNGADSACARPLPKANHWQHRGRFPSFRKRLTASNIGRPDRHPSSNSGLFTFPEPFLRIYRKQVHASAKLRGIHEDSPTYVIGCQQTPGMELKVTLRTTGWSRFVKENGLEKGDELEFSLIADSYFVVRKVD